MIKNLTKAQYYREKKIPIVTTCRRLDPEQPVRSHLIEALPRLGTEFEKISSQERCQIKTNLQLANALKIIHQLQYELEIMTTKCHEYEEQIFSSRNQNKQLDRKIVKLQQKITNLQTGIQKTQFNTKVKIEQEKQQYCSIISQYEKKLQDMNLAYSRLKDDREKQLKSAQKFHQTNINRAIVQLQEYESSTQTDLKRFQAQLQKATEQNCIMRQKIVDLQTCNQDHLRQLQKTNTQLSQLNIRIKTEYQHKLLNLKTEFDIIQNKNKELVQSVSLWEKRFGKQTGNWAEQKKSMAQQHLQNESSWKNSYEALMQQKDKILQENYRITYQSNQKQKQLNNLRDKIRRLERQVSELVEQMRKAQNQHQRSKRQAIDNLRIDYQTRISEFNAQFQRQLAQNSFKAAQNQRKLTEQKFRVEIIKYIENIKVLQNQKLENSHLVRVVQQQKRKLLTAIDQMKVQIQFLNKSNKDLSQSFRSQTESINADYNHKIKHNESIYKNQMQRLKSEHLMFYQGVKDGYENKMKQLYKQIQGKDKQIKEIELKLRKFDDDYSNQRMSFIGRVQSFQVTIGKMRNSNQQISKNNKELQSKLQKLQQQKTSIQITIQQETQTRNKIMQDLRIETENNKRLKDLIKNAELKSLQNMKKFDADTMQLKRKESILKVQIENLMKKLADAEYKIDNLTKRLKEQESNKIELQKKITQIDISSQQKWKIIEYDFAKMNEKLSKEGEKRQNELKGIIASREDAIFKANKRIQQIQGILLRQKSQYQKSYILLQNKCKQLEQANKKLIKSSFTMQDLEKENIDKDNNIRNLKKEIQRLTIQLQNKVNILNGLNMRVTNYESTIQSIKTQINQKDATIKRLQGYQKSNQTELNSLRQKAQRQAKQAGNRQNEWRNQLKNYQDEIKAIKIKHDEQMQKNIKVIEERKTIQIRIKQIQSKYESQLNICRQDKVQSMKKISQLMEVKNSIQARMDDAICKLEKSIQQKVIIIETKSKQNQNIIKIVNSSKLTIEQLNSELKKLRAQLNSQKQLNYKNSTQYERLRHERDDLLKKIKQLTQQIERISKQTERAEKDILKIYEESDRRVNIAINQTKEYYEKELSKKTKQVQKLNAKIQKIAAEQKQQWKKKQQKLNEEKQQVYKQLIIQTCKVNQITTTYEQLTFVYERVLNQLQLYKRKWQRMVYEFNDDTKQINEKKHTVTDFRTNYKKTTKITKQTEMKTERVNMETERQTPTSENSSFQQSSQKSINPIQICNSSISNGVKIKGTMGQTGNLVVSSQFSSKFKPQQGNRILAPNFDFSGEVSSASDSRNKK